MIRLSVILTLALCVAASAADAVLDQVTLDRQLGQRLPVDVPFMNEAGEPTTLGEALGGKPTLLMLGYFDCPMLCDVMMAHVAEAATSLELEPGAYRVVFLSIDPRETPRDAAHKRQWVKYQFAEGVPLDHWRLLTGTATSIGRVADALGYGYAFNKERQQYAHPAVVFVVTPGATVSHHLLGLRPEVSDMRLALVEASQGKLGSITDQVLLRCFCYDPATGKYGFAIMTALRIGGGLTVLILAGLVGILLWRHRQPRETREAQPA